MHTQQVLAAMTATAFLGACSTVPTQPQADYTLVDPGRTDMTQYQTDYADCARLANQADVGASAAGGAVVGAMVGGLIGALICGRSCAAWGAGFGGGQGAVSGGVAAARDQQFTVRGCLAGRGYNIIR